MSKALMPLMMIGSLVLIVMLQLGFIFLLLAMLPAVVAYCIDRDAGKPTFKIVGACNLAATLPSLAPVFRATLHMKHYDVGPLMGDAGTWLFVYSGAAAAWCLIYLCRFIARFIVTLVYEYTIVTLENSQKSLAEEWGQQIKHPPV